MAEKHVEVNSVSDSKFSGQDARRNFLKTSGRVAIAAPAVVLLLSAGSKSAVAQQYGPDDTFQDTTDRTDI